MKKLIRLIATLACMATLNAGAAITVMDDFGNAVTLQKPAQRVVALAPHVTEMVYAAGGASRIVAAVSYSDYPEAAKRLPKVGSNREIDMERIVALKPDLIVVWLHGTSARQTEQIRALGIPMFHSEPRKVADIASTLSRLGKLMGTELHADAAAANYQRTLADLSNKYAGAAPVRVFYQVWHKPLYTLSGGHIVSEMIRLCGGQNIFAALKVTAPVVSIEAVLQENPEVILSTGEREPAEGIDLWTPYTSLTAVRRGNVFGLDGDLLNRSGPRMAAGASALCEKLELARQRRGK